MVDTRQIKYLTLVFSWEYKTYGTIIYRIYDSKEEQLNDTADFENFVHALGIYTGVFHNRSYKVGNLSKNIAGFRRSYYAD